VIIDTSEWAAIRDEVAVLRYQARHGRVAGVAADVLGVVWNDGYASGREDAGMPAAAAAARPRPRHLRTVGGGDVS
jgi:hypothetical protein